MNNLIAQNYLNQLIKLIERFIVFETVFSESAQTCLNIKRGKCLVNENLPTVKDYLKRNYTELNSFVKQLETLSVDSQMKNQHQQLVTSVMQYCQIASHLISVIDDQNDDLANDLKRLRQNQMQQCRSIKLILQEVSKIRIKSA